MPQARTCLTRAIQMALLPGAGARLLSSGLTPGTKKSGRVNEEEAL
jgi:hypothetical protein